MKRIEEIKGILNKNKSILKEKFNIEKIGIFGSYAREEQVEESDLDMFIEYSKPLGLKFIDLINFLEKILDMKVDLYSDYILQSKFAHNIIKDVIYV